MIIEIYESCEVDEKYSHNGINIKMFRVDDNPRVRMTFEDDSGKILFMVYLDFEVLQQAVKKLEN